jgi:hypothetical protein
MSGKAVNPLPTSRTWAILHWVDDDGDKTALGCPGS